MLSFILCAVFAHFRYNLPHRMNVEALSFILHKPEIRILGQGALEGSLEGFGLECGRISPRIDTLPLLQALGEGVFLECEFRVWVRQLISWTQNDREGCGNHSVALFCRISGVFGTQNG